MKQTATNIFYSLIGFAWPVVLVLAVTPFIVRSLGEEVYGVWALVGNVVGYLAIFNSMQTAGTKYLAEYIAVDDRDSIRKLLGTSFIFNLMIGILGGVLIIVIAPMLATRIFEIPFSLQQDSISAFRLAGLGFILGTLGWWGGSILEGLQRFGWQTGVSIVMITVSTLGSLLAVWFGWGLKGVVAANVIGTLLSVFLYGISIHWLLPGVSRWLFSFNINMFQRIFAFGFFSMLQIVFGIIMSQLDRTLLGMWVGLVAVTTYSIPLSVAKRIHQLCAKTLAVVLPLSSGLDAQKRTEQFNHLFLRAQNLNVVLVLIASVPLLIIAPTILSIWIGPMFSIEATLVFRLLVISYAILALNVVMASMVAGLGHPEINTAFAALLALGTIIGYFLFIPTWGANGAAFASAIGSLIAVPIFFWYVNLRFFRIPWKKVFTASFLRPILASIIMGVCLFLIQPFITSILILLLALGGACLIFLLMTVLLGVWQEQELELLRQVWLRVSGSWVLRMPRT